MTRQFAVPAPGQPDLRQIGCTFRFARPRRCGHSTKSTFDIGLDKFFARALDYDYDNRRIDYHLLEELINGQG